ncbi:MAG: hypothetical protein ILO34_05580, partial [Kiritimatiellae bacterium]|nr:hypothetical protein [Kiritimatiellia bacterium]
SQTLHIVLFTRKCIRAFHRSTIREYYILVRPDCNIRRLANPVNRHMKSGKRPYKIVLTPLCFAETPHMFSGGSNGRREADYIITQSQ